MRRTITWSAIGFLMAVTGQAAALRARVSAGSLETAHTVRLAVAVAQSRLARPECARVFHDFSDRAGRRLQEKLETLGASGREYVSWIWFKAGYTSLTCERGHVLAHTTPGSRVVSVCPQFASAWRRDPALAEFVMIHEALHSLGLGEDPPTSAQITQQVMRRCRR